MGKKPEKKYTGTKEISYQRTKIILPSGSYEIYHPKGLKWNCKRCGACCRDTKNRPRRVLLLNSDVKRLREAGETNFSVDVNGEEPFVSEMRNVGGSCLNLKDRLCKVYSSRALLCRMYPFWIESDGKSLEFMVDTSCPGIGHGGELKEDYFKALAEQALRERGRP